MELTRQLSEARSERRAQLAATERLVERQRRLLEALPGGVVVLDGDGRVTECNPAATELLGETLQGTRWRDAVMHIFAPRPDDGHDVSLANGRRVNIATCSLGTEPGQILLIKDVTEQHELQARLAQMERLSEMGRMVASLAHQIRTPLASALLHAGNLGSPRADATARARIQDRLVDRLRHLERLVADMLAYARQGNVEVEELEVDQLLGAFAEAQSHTGNAPVRTHDEAPGARVRGNRETLHSALQNLVNNAYQAGGPDTRVTVTAVSPHPSELCIEVSDDGPGMDEATRARVFDAFYTTRAEGTGLGLAIVRNIVEAHRGTVTVDSVPGNGSVFRLCLPRIGGAAPAAVAEGRP